MTEGTASVVAPSVDPLGQAPFVFAALQNLDACGELLHIGGGAHRPPSELYPPPCVDLLRTTTIFGTDEASRRSVLPSGVARFRRALRRGAGEAGPRAGDRLGPRDLARRVQGRSLRDTADQGLELGATEGIDRCLPLHAGGGLQTARALARTDGGRRCPQRWPWKASSLVQRGSRMVVAYATTRP